MRIGIAFDLAPVDRTDDGPDDRYEEFDKPGTIEAIAAVLRSEGHEAVLLGDGPVLLRRVLDDPPDFVLNIAEGEGAGRSREARVPAVLEMLGIPYSGSDPLTLAVALDKDVAKRLVGAAGVRSPEGTKIEPWEDAEAVLSEFGRRAPCPWFIKPAFEGSSKGARSSGLVDDEARAVAVARRLAADYRQTILVEPFIDGDEVTVGLIGNPPEVECLGVMRIIPKNREGRFVYSVEVKRDYLNQVAYETPARLPETTMSAVIDSARRAYEALGCRDLARIDFRIGGGVPFFIEANPLPGLAPVSSDLVIMAEGLGISHADLIRRILRTALSRVGLWKGGPR